MHLSSWFKDVRYTNMINKDCISDDIQEIKYSMRIRLKEIRIYIHTVNIYALLLVYMLYL